MIFEVAVGGGGSVDRGGRNVALLAVSVRTASDEECGFTDVYPIRL
jgi:hypothetical protein